MQKLKIILVNLILFLILFHIADFYCSTIEPQDSWIYKNYKGLKIVQYIKNYKLQHSYSIKFDEKAARDMILADKYSDAQDNTLYDKYRPIENKNAQNSILIFGCSYAYGDSLTNQETFSYNLGKILPNYAIYNRGKSSSSTSYMLYQLEHNDFNDVKNLKYVIYLFMPDHFCRNYNAYIATLTPYYKNSKLGSVELQKYTTKYMFFPMITRRRALLRKEIIDNFFSNKVRNTKDIKNVAELTKNIILSSKAILDYKHNGTKFIILRYDRGKYDLYDYVFEELKKTGITVLSVNDLSKTDYNTIPYQISKTDVHPNAKAWREITPQFVKYMQDRGYLKD